MKRSIRLVGAMTAALLALTISPVMAEPGYYPEGPQRDVALSTLLDGGWEPCFSENYMETSTLVDSVIAACDSEYLILTGRLVDGDTLVVLAAAPREDVFTITSDQEVHLSNGTYWYFVPVQLDGDAHSLGFSGSDDVYLNTCDYADESRGISEEESSLKLCWHIYVNDVNQSLFDDGYRLGTEDGESAVYSGDYLREIYMYTGISNSPFKVDAVYNSQIAACGRDFVRDVQALISPTLNRYQSCLFYDVTKSNIAGVNADLAAAYKASVTAGKAMTPAEIIGSVQSLAIRYNTIDRLITNPESVYATDLVNIGLTGLDNSARKFTLMRELRALPKDQIDTYAELEAAIKTLTAPATK